MASTILAIVGFFKRAPPPPPPPVAEPFNFMPVLLAMLFGWVLPALTFLALTGKSKDKNGAPPISYSRNASFNSASSLYAAAANGAKVATGPTAADAPRKTHRGVLLGSASVFMMVSSAAITFPFMQTRRDALSCDALCQGGQTSLRSALNLVGASLIGRASDTLGRVPMLWVGICATLCGLGINYGMDSLEGMWLSLIPVALLNQNFSVSKALFSDYSAPHSAVRAALSSSACYLSTFSDFSTFSSRPEWPSLTPVPCAVQLMRSVAPTPTVPVPSASSAWP